MAAKFFTGLPLDGPDPECVKGHGAAALVSLTGQAPRSPVDHSRRRPVPVAISRRRPTAVPDRACDVDPLAGLQLPAQ
jgi:hypothetical protein